MLKLIQTEFLKLRRRKFVWLMLLAALFMPFFALFYFQHIGETGIDPVQFYKWTAFSYTPWIILPVVLGMLCTMLMYDENQYDMLKQLWIVPVNVHYSHSFHSGWCTSRLHCLGLEQYSISSEKMYGDQRVDCVCCIAYFSGGCVTKRVHSPGLRYFDLYISRIYIVNG